MGSRDRLHHHPQDPFLLKQRPSRLAWLSRSVTTHRTAVVAAAAGTEAFGQISTCSNPLPWMQVELRSTHTNKLWWRHVCTTAEHGIDARVVHAAARNDWAQGHHHAAAVAHPGYHHHGYNGGGGGNPLQVNTGVAAHSQEAMSTATQLPQLCPVQERWQ